MMLLPLPLKKRRKRWEGVLMLHLSIDRYHLYENFSYHVWIDSTREKKKSILRNNSFQLLQILGITQLCPSLRERVSIYVTSPEKVPSCLNLLLKSASWVMKAKCVVQIHSCTQNSARPKQLRTLSGSTKSHFFILCFSCFLHFSVSR